MGGFDSYELTNGSSVVVSQVGTLNSTPSLAMSSGLVVRLRLHSSDALHAHVPQVGSETQFRALNVAGSGQDNPTTTDLTEWQQSLSVRLLFSNVSSFEYAACSGAR